MADILYPDARINADDSGFYGSHVVIAFTGICEQGYDSHRLISCAKLS